ncbi:MAG: hypothetical protein OEY14_16240, partial [Myxococcales bacterium]|nr:hypothetical protein [Myxococcales bacterium]
SIEPWSDGSRSGGDNGGRASTVQPSELAESFSLKIEFDATDALEDEDPMAIGIGIADRLAALQSLMEPGHGALFGFAADGSRFAHRPTVPVVLFVWGPGRILPVRIASYQVNETLFAPTLFPIQAAVTLSLKVLTPDAFPCELDWTGQTAIALYRAAKLSRSALAATNRRNGVLPISISGGTGALARGYSDVLDGLLGQ